MVGGWLVGVCAESEDELSKDSLRGTQVVAADDEVKDEQRCSIVCLFRENTHTHPLMTHPTTQGEE